MAANAHARRSASATARWLACPGSLTLPVVVAKQTESEYAIEGTRAHAVAEAALRSGKIECDESEMAEAVQVYVDHIDSIRQRGFILEQIEHTLGDQDFGGTVDHYLIDHDGVAFVTDYKHGAGVAVEAAGNKQLLSYCLLILDHYPGCVESFVVAIIQPRAFNHDAILTVEVSLDEVEAHRQAILAATGDDLHVGDHCRWCS